MIYLYPANKMENLLILLNKISTLSPLGVFNQEVIVVQNAGMQHWLSLAIAKDRGISMNMRYALPAQFLWKLIRSIASDEKVPDQSPYSREVLCWRIYALLGQDKVINDEDFSQATQYWRGKLSTEVATVETTETTPDILKQALLKRYQLATQLADLYEQYLIFRPQWLDRWQQGEFNLSGLDASANSQTKDTDKSLEHKWQGKLWRYLIEESPYNPVELLESAKENIEKNKDLIPPRISFFGLNTMAPMWLDFINALSEHVEVHFFHLNPCFSYWGDVLTEKQALKQTHALAKLTKWSAGVNDEQSFVGNPLLANLGQQGREFISLLQDYSTIDIELFEQAKASEKSGSENTQSSILHQLQNDILALNDATRPENASKVGKDNSIVFTSCHSALREVQALHDYLLHQFNQDPALTPKDILVMCPQIEEYAPYVNAVFTRGWQNIDGDVPPLPCSIADRSAKDSDPLVAAFTELLTLPDSRFGVSQLLAFMRLPAMAHKFSIGSEDIGKITAWLEQASVHWGLDLAHKQTLLGKAATNSFTWQQGLSRLLRGFAFADSEEVYQNQLLLSQVEGSDSELLGQLMLFIEQLHYFSINLQRSRTATQWQTFFAEQLENLFSRADLVNNVNYENSLMVIEKAIAGLVEHCHQAEFNDDISLAIVIDYLTQHFSQGDASKQFMVGQVTFCSMLPMRSIPFKVIAVLGLNDGEFPRQRQPLAFDLMSLSKPTLGDRSRRGDDRYLFLEAIISARNALYLSYQGRNIKNNSERQPSLVVKELMEYLANGYGWQFTDEHIDDVTEEDKNADAESGNLTEKKINKSLAIYQLPMQAFSPNNYRGQWASFDANWLLLGQQITSKPNTTKDDGLNIQSSEDLPSNKAVNLSCQQLIAFYQHPSKAYAQQQLNLYFDNRNTMLDDVEPFSVNHLQSYLLRQDLLDDSLGNKSATDEVLTRALLSGKFPDLPTMHELYESYQNDAEQFADEIVTVGCDNPETINCQLTLDISSDNAVNDLIDNNLAQNMTVSLQCQLSVKDHQLVHYRSSTAKAKDKFTMYFNQLVLQVWQDQNLTTKTSIELDEQRKKLQQATESRGLYFNTKAQQVEQFSVALISDAKTKLMNLIKYYFIGQHQPLLLNADIAEKVYTKKYGKLVDMTQDRFEGFWAGNMSVIGYCEDEYLQYFWSECPNYQDHQASIEFIYQDVYESVSKLSAKKPAKSGVAK